MTKVYVFATGREIPFTTRVGARSEWAVEAHFGDGYIFKFGGCLSRNHASVAAKNMFPGYRRSFRRPPESK